MEVCDVESSESGGAGGGVVSQLAYMSKRGAGVVQMGTAAELGSKLEKLRTNATLRSNYGAVIGGTEACNGACDGDCGGWHWWYDHEGDDVQPETDEDES